MVYCLLAVRHAYNHTHIPYSMKQWEGVTWASFKQATKISCLILHFIKFCKIQSLINRLSQ